MRKKDIRTLHDLGIISSKSITKEEYVSMKEEIDNNPKREIILIADEDASLDEKYWVYKMISTEDISKEEINTRLSIINAQNLSHIPLIKNIAIFFLFLTIANIIFSIIGIVLLLN